VCTIVVTVDHRLWNTFTGNWYFLFHRNSGYDFFKSHKVAPSFNCIPGLY